MKTKKKTYADTRYGNTLLTVTHKACVSHCNILLKWTKRNMASVNHMSYQRAFEKWCMIRESTMDTSIHRSEYLWGDVS